LSNNYFYPPETLAQPSLRQQIQQQEQQLQHNLPEKIRMTMEAYKEAGLPYRKEINDDRAIRFNQIANRRPDTRKDYIVWIFRVKTGKKKGAPEKIVYYRHSTALAFNDQEESFSETVGYFKKPIATAVKDVEGNTVSVTKARDEFVFYIDYDPKALKDLIDKSATEVTQFHLAFSQKSGESWVGNNNTQYSIHNVEDFIEGEFDDLWDMAKYGYSTSEPSLKNWKANQKEIMDAAKKFKAQQTIAKQL
jgi:hypothetical protein